MIIVVTLEIDVNEEDWTRHFAPPDLGGTAAGNIRADVRTWARAAAEDLIGQNGAVRSIRMLPVGLVSGARMLTARRSKVR